MTTLQEPLLQIDFAAALIRIRECYLQDALLATMRDLEVTEVDRQLAEHVSSHSLAVLAGHGLRGELMFPVPLILAANPRLLGYYRLLYGYSQKEFYTAQTGIARFRAMEDGRTPRGNWQALLPELCGTLCAAASLLVAGFGARSLSASLLDDLTLLTLGPQLRGGANVKRGNAGLLIVFNALQEIVSASIDDVLPNRIRLRNAAGRTVSIEFAADPDIIVREEVRPGVYGLKVAIEVKAGADFSNIHNRIGEAEKSHQKARAAGYTECWTVVNVDNINMTTARRESPSSDRIYRISDLVRAEGAEYEDFRDRVVLLTGIR